MCLTRCDHCGEEVHKKPVELKRNKHNFCNADCLAGWRGSKRKIVKCDYCGHPLERAISELRRNEHNFCSPDHYFKWRSDNLVGEKSNFWKGGGRIICCDYCEEEFERTSFRVENYEHQFCDGNCRRKWMSENLRGENSPFWKGGEIEAECDYCGKVFKRIRAQLGHNSHKFCSHVCYGKWSSENRTGENHHRWKGGHFSYYGPDWFSQRQLARERDRHACQKCGITKGELGQEPDVHHIKSFSAFVREAGGVKDKANVTDELLEIIGKVSKKANQLDNLICLCKSCHVYVENNGMNYEPRDNV